MLTSIDELNERLHSEGYYVKKISVENEETNRMILDLAKALGEIYVPGGCDPKDPIIRTRPTFSPNAAPFDKAESIGWHGDFATHLSRPALSLVYITRADPKGPTSGAWRLASSRRIIAALESTNKGAEALNFLVQERLPFSYSDGQTPNWFFVIESRSGNQRGLRFYLPSIRRGCNAVYGEFPEHINDHLREVQRAADNVAEVVPTRVGSLLVVSNWFALHDRVKQTISRTRPNREALLCFVREQWKDRSYG